MTRIFTPSKTSSCRPQRPCGSTTDAAPARMHPPPGACDCPCLAHRRFMKWPVPQACRTLQHARDIQRACEPCARHLKRRAEKRGGAARLLHLAQDDVALTLDGGLVQVAVLQDVRQNLHRLAHILLQHLRGRRQGPLMNMKPRMLKLNNNDDDLQQRTFYSNQLAIFARAHAPFGKVDWNALLQSLCNPHCCVETLAGLRRGA